MFRPYIWAIIRLRLDFHLSYTSMRVVVVGLIGSGLLSHYIISARGVTYFILTDCTYFILA